MELRQILRSVASFLSPEDIYQNEFSLDTNQIERFNQFIGKGLFHFINISKNKLQ